MFRFFDRLNLTPSERRLVVIIITVVVVVVNYWFVWPRFGDFKAVSEDLTSMASKRERFEREIARRPQYEVALRKLQAEGSILPAGEEKIQFRSDMERLAREVGLYVPRWSEVLPERPSGSSSNAFFEAISITMSQVTGAESQFVDFLYRVGASNSTIRVKELNLVPGNLDARAQGSTNLIGTIKLIASVQKSAPAGSSGSKPALTAVPASAPPPVSTPRATATPPPRTNRVTTATSPATNSPAATANTRIPSPSGVSGRGSTNSYPIPVRMITNAASPRSPNNPAPR